MADTWTFRIRRRHKAWALMALAIVGTLVGGMFVLYWFVLWPVSAELVIRTSPWTGHQIRAWTKQDEGVVLGGGKTVTLYGHLEDRLRVRGVAAHQDISACLRSRDRLVRYATLGLTDVLLEAGPLPDDIQQQIVVLCDDPDAVLRGAALRAVSLLPATIAKPVLKRALAEHNRGIRRTALEGLALAGEFEVTAWILPCLQDPDPFIRGLAVRTLTTIGDRSAIPHVQALAGDSNQYVTRGVSQFLTQVGTASNGTERDAAGATARP